MVGTQTTKKETVKYHNRADGHIASMTAKLAALEIKNNKLALLEKAANKLMNKIQENKKYSTRGYI